MRDWRGGTRPGIIAKFGGYGGEVGHSAIKAQMDDKSTALFATCHCGQVELSVAVRPDYINECNCSLCDSHGAWWGYYAVGAVEVTGAVSS